MAPSVVQTQSNTGSGATSVVVTLTSTGSQHTLICCIGGYDVDSYAESVTTSGGQSLVAAAQDNNSEAWSEIWYLDNVPAGETSVTVDWTSSADDVGVVVYEVSGVYASGGSLDKTSENTTSGSSPTSWTSDSTATLSQSSEIAVGASGQFGLSLAITGPSSPWANIKASVGNGALRSRLQHCQCDDCRCLRGHLHPWGHGLSVHRHSDVQGGHPSPG